MVVSEPSVGFRVEAKSGAIAGPTEFLADVDLLLRFAFVELNFNADGGLLISGDDRPWNSPQLFDSQENVTDWFERVAELASGATEPISVWAWEQSHCLLTPVGTDLVRLEDDGFCPPIHFGRIPFLAAFLAAGLELLALQEAVYRRIGELLAQRRIHGVPITVSSWATALPRAYLTERVVRSSASFVQTEGMSLGDRWSRVLAVRYSPERRTRIRSAVGEIGAVLAGR